MATLTAKAPQAQPDPPARHGRSRLFITINESVYSLIPRHGVGHPAWELIAKTGPRPGARYLAESNGTLACTCPDHTQRGTRCKHLGALVAAQLLPVPAPATAAPAPKPAARRQRRQK